MRAAVAVLVVLAFAGCLEEVVHELGASHEFLPGSVVQLDPASASVSRAVLFGGGVAAVHPGVMLDWEAECPCQASEFVVQSAFADEVAGWLDVRVRWDGTKTADLVPELVTPDRRAHFGGERGFDDRLLRLWAPESGIYSLAVAGEGQATITVRLGSHDLPETGELRPNLVELVLEGPHVGTCDQVETAEQGAVRCMRFGNGVGNPGHGPVQIRLTVDQAAMALAPLQGRFVQEIRQADGSLAEHPVGPATFHPTHAHWHYDGLAVFELYPVGEDGLRGDAVASHGKSGFCFLDWDTMPENTTDPAEQERAEADCLVPGPTSGSWTNGISRGWYDFYYHGLTDQYVDIDGLPDGVYELVASADPLGTLEELDETDNQSSLLIEISGNDVDVLEERGHYRVQAEDDA